MTALCLLTDRCYEEVVSLIKASLNCESAIPYFEEEGRKQIWSKQRHNHSISNGILGTATGREVRFTFTFSRRREYGANRARRRRGLAEAEEPSQCWVTASQVTQSSPARLEYCTDQAWRTKVTATESTVPIPQAIVRFTRNPSRRVDCWKVAYLS